MAGTVTLATQGITSPFSVEPQAPTPHVKNVKNSGEGKKIELEKSEETLPGQAPKKAVEDVANALNSVAKLVAQDLSFSVDHETGRIVIKVTNKETGELIRVIPPEEITTAKDSLSSLVGLLFNDKS